MSSTKSYGTEEPPTQEQHIPSSRCGLLGPDAPVVFLDWLLFVELLAPLMLMPTASLAIIAAALTFTQVVIIAFLSQGSGRWWKLVSGDVTAGFIMAIVGGWFARPTFIAAGVTYDGQIIYIPPKESIVACCEIVCAVFVMCLIWSWTMNCLGIRVIGSSAEVADGSEIIWQPHKASVMDFGCERTDGHLSLLPQTENYTPKLLRNLLNGTAFWSGEFMFDYAFHTANHHLVMGCFFCHPAHPYTKMGRTFVLLVVILLIVFPVSAFSVTLPNNLLRTLLMAASVACPRTFLRKAMTDAATHDWKAVLAEHEQAAECGRLLSLTKEEEETIWKGRLHQFCFFGYVSVFTAIVVFVCCYVIRAHNVPLVKTLSENLDGIIYAYYLDLVFDLIAPFKGPGDTRCFGFLHGWLAGRDARREELRNSAKKQETHV